MQELRQAVAAYQEAKENGDPAATAAAQSKLQQAWKALPPRMQARIEERHPATGQRIAGMQNHAAAASSGSSAASGSASANKSVTGPGGNTTTSDKTWTKNGNTVTEQGTVTGPNGHTATSNATWTKSGSTLTKTKPSPDPKAAPPPSTAPGPGAATP